MIRKSVLFACLVYSSVASGQSYTNLIATSDLHHWMKPDGAAVDKGWELKDGGVLHLSGSGGNIITREKFTDFELWFEFRISEKGNSGIKYRVRNYGKSLLGIEYQILDDAAFPKLKRKSLTASFYDVMEPIAAETRLNPAGTFNIGKIRVQGDQIQHWVNGQLTINACAGSDLWHEKIKASKFSNRENFGQNRSGHIMLTDHHSEVWLRNVFIRRLN